MIFSWFFIFSFFWHRHCFI